MSSISEARTRKQVEQFESVEKDFILVLTLTCEFIFRLCKRGYIRLSLIEFGEPLARLRALLRRGHDVRHPTLAIASR